MHTQNKESGIPYPTGREAWGIKKGRDGVNRLAILDYNINVAEYNRVYEDIIYSYTLVGLADNLEQGKYYTEDLEADIKYLYNPRTKKHEIWVKKPTETIKKTIRARIEMLGL